MCLILLGRYAHPDYELVLAANRDELFGRPTARAAWWEDHPDVLGGRDLDQMGTWLGITRSGRWAAITNFRGGAAERKDAPSRGGLVGDFLTGRSSTGEYLELLQREGGRYNGYNLLFATGGSVAYQSNRGAASIEISPGIHGLSNHLLDTSWPKVVRGKERLAALLAAQGPLDIESLFDLLSDRSPAAADELPATGVGPALERILSPIFIDGDGYGTRCSTVLLIGRSGDVYFEERDLRGSARRRFEFSIE